MASLPLRPRSVKFILYPFTKLKCEQNTCPLCSDSRFVKVSQEEIKVTCNTNNVGYRWCCVTCEETNTNKLKNSQKTVFFSSTRWQPISMSRSNSEWKLQTNSKMLSRGKPMKNYLTVSLNLTTHPQPEW